MCGILGGWVGEGLPPLAINEALERLRHRGPDDQGFWESAPAFLGMRRLAIIDVEGGHQPMFNEDQSIAVVLNGEIYNYLELLAELKARGHLLRTHSDTEVLVHGYEEWGEGMVEQLRGMFAFALWDGRRRRLLLARDRFGKKPLYYTRTAAGWFLFASELKALQPLAAATGASWKIRDQSIYDYLSLGVVPQPDTVYEDVWMVPPACWLTFDGNKTKNYRYWRLNFEPKVKLAYGDVLEQTRVLISDAVRIRLRSDVPVGVFLSGGIDSSVVAYEAVQHGGGLQTFTVAVDDPAFDESEIAGHTARTLGVANTLLRLQVSPREELLALVRHYDQPFADSSAIPSCAISRLASSHLKVVLNGDGGDELFAGYRRYLAAGRLGKFGWVPQPLFAILGAALARLARHRRSHLGFYTRFARGMALPAGGRYLAWTTDLLQEADKQRCWSRANSLRPTEEWIAQWLPPGWSSLDAQLYADQHIILLSTLLVKMDMATMAASLEGRSPFMDHVLAEFTATLPACYLLGGGRTKAVLRDAYAGLVPAEVVKGKKRGFEIPLASWLRIELRELLQDTVGAADARVRGFLDSDFIEQLLAGQILQDRNWAHLTYAVLVLELWLRGNE